MFRPIQRRCAHGKEKKELSQRALAGKLNMSYRTILDLENGKSSPKAETVFLIATYLNISLDAILFDEDSDTMSPTVLEFFSGKTQEEANRYIALCQQADALRE